MNFHLKDLASAVFEEDNKSALPQQPETHTPAAPVAVSAPIITESVPVAVGVPDADIYQRIVAKTDWESTPVFQAIKKHLAPMEGVAIDAKTKFSVALKQAAALDGINPADVAVAFENAKANLQNLLNNFHQAVLQKTVTEVDAKKKQAEELQAKVQQLTQEAFDAQTRLQTQQHAYEVAAGQRMSEITQKQAEYASLLS
jgi:hypothetical protein